MLDQSTIDHLLTNPPETLGEKVAATVGRGRLSAADVAQACGVTIQAVNGWKKNGRVDKRHIKTLSGLSGLPAEWWLPGFERIRGDSGSQWPFEYWVPYSKIQSLDDLDKGYVACRIVDAVAELESRHKKSAPTEGAA